MMYEGASALSRWAGRGEKNGKNAWKRRGGKWEEEHLEDACVCLPGYMEVVQIPKGSVHLEIKELTLSKNYIGKSQICRARSAEPDRSSTFRSEYRQYLSVFSALLTHPSSLSGAGGTLDPDI